LSLLEEPKASAKIGNLQIIIFKNYEKVTKVVKDRKLEDIEKGLPIK